MADNRRWVRLAKPNARVLAAILLLGALALVPPLSSNYVIVVLTFVFALSILAASFDVVYGYAGQVNLGAVFPYGIGAFATALLDIHTTLPTWLNFILGPIIAVIAGLAFAGPSLRLTGNYFGIVTWMMALIANELALLQTGEEGLTDGVRQLFGGNPLSNYYFALILLALSCGILLWLGNSIWGTRLKAIREDQVIAEALGINSTTYKLEAFAVSNFFAGLAGAFVASYIGHVDYNFFAYNSLSFQIIAMTIVGGAGTIIGPIVGVFLLYIPLSVFLSVGLYSYMIYATILVVAVLFVRQGLVPTILRLATGSARKKS